MPKLEGWSWLHNGSLAGRVYNDDKGRFKDGAYIYTSLVQEYSLKDGNRFAQTLNTRYELGDSEWEEYRKERAEKARLRDLKEPEVD